MLKEEFTKKRGLRRERSLNCMLKSPQDYTEAFRVDNSHIIAKAVHTFG